MKLVISGVGTGVGKTHVACALAATAHSLGLSCAAVKPVETGGGADGAALAIASHFTASQPAPYSFAATIAPHVAARQLGIEIDVRRCCQWVDEMTGSVRVQIVELAGGLLSPLSSHARNAELLRELAPDGWVAVASDRLGVIHEIASLMICVRALELPPPLIVLDAALAPDQSSGTNGAELQTLGVCTVAAQFPRATLGDGPTQAAATALARAASMSR
jgi:dethiobiotin synthetase